MFFPAMTSDSIPGSPLPERLTFTLEHQASQVLVGGDITFLHTATENGTLTEVLFREVEFLGSIPKEDFEMVRAYFIVHHKTLKDAVIHLFEHPDDNAFRATLTKPLSLCRRII